MDIQTQAMREMAGPDKMIHAYQGPFYDGDEQDAKLWHGIEYVNHPTPSGCERWLPTISDKRGWPDKETAIVELKKLLQTV